MDNRDGVFDIEEESESQTKSILKIPEDYSYENIINNPILKPISECDRSVRNMEEMKIKELNDSKKVMAWINQTLMDNPEYGNIYFVSQLIDLLKKYSFIVKIDRLQSDEKDMCINEMFKLTRSEYARKGEDDEYYKIETSIDKESEEEYLIKVSNSEDPKISEIAKSMLANYQSDKSSNPSKKKFNDAFLKIYSLETDQDKKKLMAKVYRRQI